MDSHIARLTVDMFQISYINLIELGGGNLFIPTPTFKEIGEEKQADHQCIPLQSPSPPPPPKKPNKQTGSYRESLKVDTPNCKNVVIEKWKKKEKAKWKLIRLTSLMNLFAVSSNGRPICPLEFAIVLKLKEDKTENSSGEIQRLQMNPPWECGLISLFNSYSAFSFCHFSKTTLL